MTRFQAHVMVFFVLIWNLKLSGAYPQNGHVYSDRRPWWEVHCRSDLAYISGNLCCLNCPAGTRLVSACLRSGEVGKCEDCEDGTYMEFSNKLQQCFKCTQCRKDQEIVRPCTHTQDVECQCKFGGFCSPDEACEVCKTCSRCNKDGEMVRNCTATANTECKKIQSNPGSASGSVHVAVIVPLVIVPIAAGIFIVIAVIVCRHRRATGPCQGAACFCSSMGTETCLTGLKMADSRRNRPNELKAGQHSTDPSDERRNGETRRPTSLILSRQLVRAKSSTGTEDECEVLCESLSSSSSNSQLSLTGLSSAAFLPPPPQIKLMIPRLTDRREDESFPKLLPVNGEQSLRKCFEYLEEIDINHHKRFFRHIGLNDNMIRGKEHLPYEDKIHELLNIWVEKEGREATLNDLLRALLDLNQRRTAETVKEKAIHNGHYRSEDQ